jgi:hypothetical protein
MCQFNDQYFTIKNVCLVFHSYKLNQSLHVLTFCKVSFFGLSLFYFDLQRHVKRCEVEENSVSVIVLHLNVIYFTPFKMVLHFLTLSQTCLTLYTLTLIQHIHKF